MRSFLESLDSEHASSATSVKVKVPAVLIDAISFEESAVTLTRRKTRGRCRCRGPWLCWTGQRNSFKLTVRTVGQGRFSLRRRVASARPALQGVTTCSLEEGSESNRKRATIVPQAFGAIVEQIAAGGTGLQPDRQQAIVIQCLSAGRERYEMR